MGLLIERDAIARHWDTLPGMQYPVTHGSDNGIVWTCLCFNCDNWCTDLIMYCSTCWTTALTRGAFKLSELKCEWRFRNRCLWCEFVDLLIFNYRFRRLHAGNTNVIFFLKSTLFNIKTHALLHALPSHFHSLTTGLYNRGSVGPNIRSSSFCTYRTPWVSFAWHSGVQKLLI